MDLTYPLITHPLSHPIKNNPITHPLLAHSVSSSNTHSHNNTERKVARLDRAREMERKRRMLTKKQGKLTGPQPPEQENFYDFFVIKIQALVRGFNCRCWLQFRKEMATPSSIQIQRIVRGRLARRRAFHIRQRLKAAIELQRVFRGYRARLKAKAAMKDKTQHLAAIEIQRVWRGKMAKIRVQVRRTLITTCPYDTYPLVTLPLVTQSLIHTFS